MKTNLSQLAIGLIAGMVLVVLMMGHLAPAQAAPEAPGRTQSSGDCDPTRSIQVSGAATINVVPDRVEIKLGIESTDPTAQGVQDKSLQSLQALMAALQGIGVDKKDIATDTYVVYPVHKSYDEIKITGYRIDLMIAITLRDPSKTSDVLTATFKAGANKVINVEFYTTELRKYRDEARKLALQAAKEKADLLTGGVGAETGCVLNIQEQSRSNYYGWWNGYGSSQNLWSQNTVQNAMSDPSQAESGETDDGPISLGQVAVRAEVSVQFAIR
ncbi:MAG: SIMPL domain-containing protein [Herpetosiphonaceae bacterium]|nr:SIMPL domain-containing protein [Herpetosiphonaceae bacterium]